MKELSTKDLQAQIDFIVRKFQDNGMAFEAMKVDFAKAFDGFSLFAKQADVNSLLEKVNESFKAEGESIKSRFRSVDQSFETMRQGFSSINDRHASFDRSIQSLKDAHGVLLEKMQSIINEEKNHVQIREFSDLKASLDAHK
jgi:vacuolar-type H+-ATPase subunit I/STV1